MSVCLESNTCLNLTFSFLGYNCYIFFASQEKISVCISTFILRGKKFDEERKREILILTLLIRFKFIYHKTQEI